MSQSKRFVDVRHGGDDYEIRKFDDGRLGCPICAADDNWHNSPLFSSATAWKIHAAQAHDILGYETRECAHDDCESSFQARQRTDQKYCSCECGQLAGARASRRRADANTETCERCGDEFRVAPSQSRKFCSHDCHRAHLTASNECKHCGKETDQAALTGFCSNECFFADSTGGDQ